MEDNRCDKTAAKVKSQDNSLKQAAHKSNKKINTFNSKEIPFHCKKSTEQQQPTGTTAGKVSITSQITYLTFIVNTGHIADNARDSGLIGAPSSHVYNAHSRTKSTRSHV